MINLDYVKSLLTQMLANKHFSVAVIGGQFGQDVAHGLCRRNRPDNPLVAGIANEALTDEVLQLIETLEIPIRRIAWNPVTRILEVYLHRGAFTYGVYSHGHDATTVVSDICQSLTDIFNGDNQLPKPFSDEQWAQWLGLQVNNDDKLCIRRARELVVTNAIALSGDGDRWLTLDAVNWQEMLLEEWCEETGMRKKDLFQPVVYIHADLLSNNVIHAISLSRLNSIIEMAGGEPLIIGADGKIINYR